MGRRDLLVGGDRRMAATKRIVVVIVVVVIVVGWSYNHYYYRDNGHFNFMMTMDENSQERQTAGEGVRANSPGDATGTRLWAQAKAIGVVSILFAVMLGLFSGMGVFTFGYGQGGSYLRNNPQSCRNCHVMQGHFDSWQHSSHHHVAVCNDCHLPHDSVGKLVTEADNGFFHSLAFTMQDYHEPIQIKPRNRRVTQQTCLNCHQETVHWLLPSPEPSSAATSGQLILAEQETISCVHCHNSVGHGLK